MESLKKKKLFAGIVVGVLGVALVVIARPMAKGGFFNYILGIVILVGGVFGLKHLEEMLSNKKKGDRSDER